MHAYHIAFTINSQKKKIGAEIYIHDHKDTYEQFKSHASEIEQELGVEVIWREANKDCRILVLNDGDAKKDRHPGKNISIGSAKWESSLERSL